MIEEIKMLARVIDTTEITFSKTHRIGNFPHAQLLLCEKGSGNVICFNGLERAFNKGDLLCLKKGLYYIFRTDEKVKMRKIACDLRLAPNIMDYFKEDNLNILQNSSKEIRRLYTELFEQGKNTAASDNTEISLKLYRLLIMIGQEMEENIGEERVVLEAMAKSYCEYMFRRFKADDEVNVPKEIDMLFERLYGMNAQQVNISYRLDVGRGYVAFGHPLNEIAYNCGFETEERLRIMFKEYFGMTVEEYIGLF